MLGYTSWHKLIVYSYFTCLLPARLFILLLFSCLFIILFSYLMFAVYLVILLCTLFICTSSPLYTHTLTRSLSDDPGFARPDIGRLILLFRCSLSSYALRGVWSLSLPDTGILIPLAFLYSCDYSLWFLYITLSFCSISYFMWYHVWIPIYHIVVILIHYSLDS